MPRMSSFSRCRQLLLDCGLGGGGAPSGQADVLSEVVCAHRVLLFCQQKSMLNIVEKDLLKYVWIGWWKSDACLVIHQVLPSLSSPSLLCASLPPPPPPSLSLSATNYLPALFPFHIVTCFSCLPLRTHLSSISYLRMDGSTPPVERQNLVHR